MALDIRKVREIMLSKGISPKELASSSEIDKSTISKILSKDNPKARIKTIHSLAKGLGVEPKTIIRED